MNFNARQYDPQIGSFLGVDPLADAYGQQVYSPYAAMGNMPESAVDPNGTNFQVKGDAAFASEQLGNWFGAGNFSIDDNGWVSICKENEEAAILNYTEYLMKVGGGEEVLLLKKKYLTKQKNLLAELIIQILK